MKSLKPSKLGPPRLAVKKKGSRHLVFGKGMMCMRNGLGCFSSSVSEVFARAQGRAGHGRANAGLVPIVSTLSILGSWDAEF